MNNNNDTISRKSANRIYFFSFTISWILITIQLIVYITIYTQGNNVFLYFIFFLKFIYYKQIIIFALLCLGIVLGIVNEKKADVKWIKDHFIWQRNTFILTIASYLAYIFFLKNLYNFIVNYFTHKLNIPISENFTFLLLHNIIYWAIILWFMYRTAKGSRRMKEERSPYNIGYL